MRAIVVEGLSLVRIIPLGLYHLHAQDTSADWALEESLALILLRLRLGHSQRIIAELAIEVLDVLLHAEPTVAFLALGAEVHLFLYVLPVALAFVVHIRRAIFCQTVHI